MAFCFASCSEDKLSQSIITIPDESNTEIDHWIRQNLTIPHNIELSYKWEDSETDIGKNLVPPKEEILIPFLDIMKKVWIDVYIEVAGPTFFNTLTPKKIVLIGSANFNNDGTITQGTAEAGRKIVLYQVNDFNFDDMEQVKEYFHVIHHEFAHIMHQTRMYDETEYGNITPSGYRSDWQNEKDIDAYNQGFISKYARMNPSEDFVEMIAFMITLSRDEFTERIKDASAAGQEAIRTKEAFVASYYKKVWNIDVYDFQEVMAVALENLN